jgi:NitT/TauT family transport system substrate-binding protein
VGEPWITRILQEEHVVLWLKANDIIPDFQYSAIYYGVNLLEKNPEAGQRFMAAYLKAVRQYNQGKTTRNLDILVKHTGLERELLQNACWPPIHGDGHINVESVLEFQTWAVEKGWLDTVVPANQFWNPRYVEYAIQVLGASE